MAGIPISVLWLAVLAVLLVIEIATLGLTTIWFAGGALIAFLVPWQEDRCGCRLLFF